MGDVVGFRRPKPAAKAEGNALCSRGFHKWAIVQEKPFEVRSGKLITLYRCLRCGHQKVETR